MRHRFITHKREGLHWVVGTRLVAEFGEPGTPLEMSKPPKGIDLFDEKRRPLYTIDEKGELTYQGRPQADLDADLAEQEVRHAQVVVRRHQIVLWRLVLWAVDNLWWALNAKQKNEIRAILPDAMKAEIGTAVEKLP